MDYSKRIGKVKYWIIASLPMIYYLIYYFNLFSYFNTDDFTFYLIFAVNSTYGAILFAWVFLSARKTIRKDSKLREYLLILAGGILMLFTSNQATAMGTSFPPFGILTVSMAGLSGYLIFIGTTLSSLSISQDNIIKKEIRKKINSELKVLKEITTSEEIRQLEIRVSDTIIKNKELIEEESGIRSNTSNDDIMKYINEIMEEKVNR